MILQANWIHGAGTQSLCRAFANRGYSILFVGGCVRDGVLERHVSDIDLSTNARPEQVMQIAEDAGFRAIPTGIDHGTVTVIAGNIAHEITTFRRDIETDGRRATVAFTNQIEDDAKRRDFTINALYADALGQVIDPLGTGLSDLQAKRLRFIGDPHDRIGEDYLRILRFFRFHAHYANPADGIDADGLAACAEMVEGLEQLSRERVGAEMRKLLQAPDPGQAVAAMVQSGVLMRVLPGSNATALPLLIHLENFAGLAPDYIRRLALLGGADVVQALRLSKHDAAGIANRRKMIGATAQAGELGYRLGAEAGLDVVLLRAALMEMTVTQDDLDRVARGAQQVCPVRPVDLQAIGLSGPALGVAHRQIIARWIASDFTLTKAQLLA